MYTLRGYLVDIGWKDLIYTVKKTKNVLKLFLFLLHIIVVDHTYNFAWFGKPFVRVNVLCNAGNDCWRMDIIAGSSQICPYGHLLLTLPCLMWLAWIWPFAVDSLLQWPVPNGHLSYLAINFWSPGWPVKAGLAVMFLKTTQLWLLINIILIHNFGVLIYYFQNCLSFSSQYGAIDGLV